MERKTARRKVEKFEDDSMRKLWSSENYVSKVDVYKWNKPAQKGEFMWISKDELKIDLCYQREADNKNRVAEIARNFDWSLFGVILVSFNADGYFVIDGGHRVRGACRRDDINELPCLVFVFEDVADEARVFYLYNNQRKTVGIFDNHKAALVGGESFEQGIIAIKAEKLVEKYGYKFSKCVSGPFEISCIKTIYRMVEQDEVLAEKCFSILARAAEGAEIQSLEIGGLFYLMQTNRAVDFETFPLRNMIESGMLKIREEIRRLAMFESKGGAKTAAKALLGIINRGQQKTKVFVP